MIDLQKYVPGLIVNLEPGIYVLPRSSASGKTYICSILRELSEVERVNSYTYYDKVSGLSLEQLLDSSKYDLLMLDRYDMYYGDCTDGIESFARTGVVMIDCKALRMSFSAKLRLIDMKKDKLVVSLDYR